MLHWYKELEKTEDVGRGLALGRIIYDQEKNSRWDITCDSVSGVVSDGMWTG